MHKADCNWLCPLVTENRWVQLCKIDWGEMAKWRPSQKVGDGAKRDTTFLELEFHRTHTLCAQNALSERTAACAAITALHVLSIYNCTARAV